MCVGEDNLFCVLIQSFNNRNKTGVFADGIVSFVLQFVKHIVAICVFCEFMEILVFLGIDLSINQE